MSAELIINFLNKLGEQIAGVSKDIYAIYVKQAYVTGTIRIALSVVLMIILAIIISRWFKVDKKNISASDKEDLYFVLSTISFIVVVIILVILPSGIKHTLNPNYYAIQDLINSIK